MPDSALLCETCKHYRPCRKGLVEKQLRTELQHLHTPFERIAGNARHLEKQILQDESAPTDILDESWEQEPRLAEFCAVHRFRGDYYVCRIKGNPTAGCRDYQPARSSDSEHRCDLCLYRSVSREHQAFSEQYVSMARLEAALSKTGNLLSGIASETKKTFEQQFENACTSAFEDSSLLEEHSKFFNTCSRLTFNENGDVRRVLCARANPSNRCELFFPASADRTHTVADRVPFSFDLGSFSFQRHIDSQLSVNRAFFIGSVPMRLLFDLNSLPEASPHTLVGTIGATITIHQQRGAFTFSVSASMPSQSPFSKLYPIGIDRYDQ